MSDVLSPILEKHEFHKVVGEIYKITNNVNGKCYVGQTRSHRLNHGKYREFGYMGRFRDHISCSNSTKKNKCKYLNSAILKYGSDNFSCQQLMVCKLEDLDRYEQMYISEFSTKFPNGYNLTDGGQGIGSSKGSKIILDLDSPEPIPKPRNYHLQTEHTRSLISSRIKNAMTDEIKEFRMYSAQTQHQSKKFEKFKNVRIDNADIEKYIRVSKTPKIGEYITVSIDSVVTTFVGKHETLEQTKQRAIEFIQSIITWQRDQIAGNSLELSTTTP